MDGTPEQPWVLKTPSGGSEFTAHRDESLDPPALVVQVGKTQVRYHLRCLDDLAAMLRERGDWVPLGSADEQKPAAEGTVEAWARAEDNPVGGWYGLKKGLALPSRSPAAVAQLVEHVTRNDGVSGSNPLGGSEEDARLTRPSEAPGVVAG